MEEKESVILEQVRKIFMRYGIRSVTMDDISRELKISKKTLYKYVTDKSDLVEKVMRIEISTDQELMKQFEKESKTAIDEVLMILKHIAQKVKEIHPSIHYDLEKYYPEAWEVFNNHKKNFIMGCVIRNLQRGILEGLYRENLNAEIIALIYVSRVDIVFDGEIFPPTRFNFADVLFEMFRYHIKGIASEKGIKYLHEKIKNETINI